MTPRRINQAISRKGKLPYTVVILDEVQQFINDDAGRSKAVQVIFPTESGQGFSEYRGDAFVRTRRG